MTPTAAGIVAWKTALPARAVARLPATSIGVNCAGTRMRVLASQTGNESVPKIIRINDAMNLS